MRLSELVGGASAEPAARAMRTGLVVVTRPAAVVPIDVALRLGGGGSTAVWDAAEGDGRFAFAGFGAAARVEASGEHRFDELRARSARLFAGVVEVRHAGAEGAPAPRLFGGISFALAAAHAPPWTGFADASFTMPRMLYATDGSHAFVRVAASAGSAAVDALVADASVFSQTLEAAARSGERMGVEVEADTGADSGALCDVAESEFLVLCEELVGRIQAGELTKVALTLRACARLARPVDLPLVLARLGRAYPDCARFAFEREGRTFVGASPERLVSLRDGRVEADALAGSIARADGREADLAQRCALLSSAKDRVEHDLVVRAIHEALSRSCVEVVAPGEPRVRSLRNVHHLWTPVHGRLHPGGHVLDVVAALHPTPAVGGVPRAQALAWLSRSERHERGWYTGAVGWFDASGEGSFAVGLRAALCGGEQADLYAGAGIVEGSVPELELAEVRLKLRAMVSALGLSS